MWYQFSHSDCIFICTLDTVESEFRGGNKRVLSQHVIIPFLMHVDLESVAILCNVALYCVSGFMELSIYINIY